MNNKSQMCLRWVIALLIGVAGISPSAWADASTDQRIANLEQKLEQSLQIIHRLSDRVVELENQQRDRVQPPIAPAEDLAETVDERFQAVEESVEDIEERIGSRAVINAFDGLQLDIGGFTHTAYTLVEGEDRDTKAFNRVNFELLIKAQITESISAFFAGGFLRESDDPFNAVGDRRNPRFNNRNKNPQIISYADWAFSDALNVKAGRFITPHGIINIEHFPAILLDPEQPQFLRPFGGDTIFPNFSNGIQLHGKFFLGADQLQYYTYASNFVGNPEKTLFGTRLAYQFGRYGITLGGNYAYGSRARGADDNLNYDLVGLDLFIDKGPILWKTEVFLTEEEGQDRLGYYTQPAWRLDDQWLVFYRYDFLDDGGDTAGDAIEQVFGLNYLPAPNVRLRSTLTFKHFKNGVDRNGLSQRSADATSLQFSGTFSF